jgi:uncharacterized metal-binding protein YceD (DUF177 family)
MMTTGLYFPVSISSLPKPSEHIHLPVDAESLKQLANECGVNAFKSLETDFRFKRWRKHGATVVGSFKAEIEQDCIVTLEPVFSFLDESFERQFLPQRSSDYKMPEIIDGEMILDPEADDLPDILETDVLNLWEILIEELILAIDPFPRSAEGGLQEQFEAEEEDLDAEPTHKPFSDLQALISAKKTNK